MDELEGKVAVITGGASGIGYAMGEAFAAEGMRVVLADIEKERLAAAAKTLADVSGAEVRAVETDVSKPESVEALCHAAYDAFGAVHVLCNNAGVATIGATWEHTLDDWRWLLDVNLWGVIYGVHYFLPRMMAQEEGGHIVNTASMAGLGTSPFMSIYDVTKFGVMALSESLWKELRVSGSKVSATVVCPGLINTDIMSSRRNRPAERAETGAFGEAAQGFRQALTNGLASGYPPSEVARQVLECVKEDRFYCIPAQERVFEGALMRFDDIRERRNPTLR